jgi:hypothetical protein
VKTPLLKLRVTKTGASIAFMSLTGYARSRMIQIARKRIIPNKAGNRANLLVITCEVNQNTT